MSILIGYARVSTVDQNPELQLDELNRAGCRRIFTDTASGARSDRPELRATLNFLQPGDVLVVWRLDRLARSLADLIAIVTGLVERGVGFRSLRENIDTTSAGGKLVFHLFGALAEFERDLIRERTQAGLAAARARGRVGGRPTKLTADQAAMARALLATGKSGSEVAKAFGVGRSTLYRVLGHIAAPRGRDDAVQQE
jgi:DNA invertase Pin-like site-specific DNA recombinase